MPAAVLVLAAVAMLAPASAAAAKKHHPARSIATVKGVQNLEPTALRRWPGSFGGIWLSHGKLFVAFTGKGKKRIKKLSRPLIRKGRLPKRRFRVVTVDDSLRSLKRLEDRMIADRDAPPPPVIGPPPNKYDLDVDVRRNTVAVIAPNVTPQLVDYFKQAYGDVAVEQGPLAEPNASCTSRDDCSPFLRSGLRSIAESGTGCSLAFGVLYQSGFEKVDGILSAAHCGNPGADVGDDRLINGVVYGQVVAEQQSGMLDAELHSVGNGYVSFFPMIYRNSTDYAATVGKVGTYNGLLIGSTVCKSGYKTGESCGPVLSKTYSPSYVPGGTDFSKAGYCSDHGDSGAGVYSSFQRQKPNKKKPVTRYEALGIHSGGAKNTPCSSSQHYSLFGHIEFVQSALGVKVLSNPN
jgi:hypothetical protein